MTNTRKRKPLSDDEKIAKARLKLTSLKLDADEILPKLLKKYGAYSYDFIMQATATPAYVAQRTNQPFMSSKALILHYANDQIPDDTLAKAIKKNVDDIKQAAAQYQTDQNNRDEQVRRTEDRAQEDNNRMSARLRIRSDGSVYLERPTAQNTPPTRTQPTTPSTPTTDPVVEGNSPEEIARNKARAKLEEMKQGRTGEVSLQELNQQGVQKTDMQNVVTEQNFTEIHAGNMGRQIAADVEARDRRIAGYGNCAGITADTLVTVTGRDARMAVGGRNRNSGTRQTNAMHNFDEWYMFDFPNNQRTGNPAIANLTEPGTYIGWAAARNATQPAGHAAFMGSDSKWHCDCTQSREYMASTKPAKRYAGANYSIGFYQDCTVTDNMAEDMLYQKYLREEKERARQATHGQTMPQATQER